MKGKSQPVPGRRFVLPLCCALLLPPGCAPTPYVAQKHVRYDFTTEGFLSPHLLQTIGRTENTELGTRRQCLERALETAVRRAIRVMLHTKHEIAPESTRKTTPGVTDGDPFDRSYPFRFTERDYVRALLDFDPLLRRSYLALQDARSRENCTVVLRIETADLPAQIRSVRLTFVPEGLDGHGSRRYRETQRDEKTEPFGKTQPTYP